MKKFLVIALAVFAFVACNNFDDDALATSAKGTVINFGTDVQDTRTAYEHTDATQIVWETGDTIRVYCKNAQVGKITGNDEEGNPVAEVTNANAAGAVVSADYVVTPQTEKKKGSLAPANANSVLLWGEGNHEFFAIYPHNAAVTVTEEGVATFPINRNQVCKVLTAAEVTADNNANGKADYTYIVKPDMKNQYMVEYTQNSPAKDNVWLKFDPIMTTINIVLNGPIDASNESNTNVADVEITGVSIVSKSYATTNNKTQFQYDIKNGVNTGSAGLVGKDSEGNQLYDSQTTFISFDGSNANAGSADEEESSSAAINTIRLGYGETLSVTAFLPPMALSTMDNLNRSVAMRVHTIGGSRTLTIEKADLTNSSWETDGFLSPSAKGKVTLPNIYTPINGANWITPLDDDIYVAQLSIPGTHDAATSTISAWGTGKCQTLSITQQLNIGVRYFDLRPTCPNSGDETNALNAALQINHGSINTGSYFDDYNGKNGIITEFKNFLLANPKEFVILMVKWEPEGDARTDFNWIGTEIDSCDPTVFNKAYANFLTKHKDIIYAGTFNKDLTIGDLRGKVLVINRPAHGVSDNDANAFYARTATAGNVFLNNYPGGGGSEAYESCYFWLTNEQTGTQASSTYVGRVFIQDFWKIRNSYELKKEVIAKHLNHAATTHTDTPYANYDNVWYINHMSGYDSGSSSIFNQGTGVTSEYARNAHRVNLDIYEYLLGETKTFNGTSYTKPIGSTGILVFDFAGCRYLRESDGVIASFFSDVLYGDLLPQTVIDNNYKYEMKRKTN